MLCWLVEFAAYLINRCDIGTDGKTPLHRLYGQHKDSGIWAKILYMLAKPARGGKWDLRFYPGVPVGMLNSSSESVVVTEQGSAIEIRAANVRGFPSRKDGMRIKHSECDWSRGLQRAVTTRSTSKSEWRDPLRWCFVPLAKF